MSKAKTLVLLKPQAVKRQLVGEIISRLEKADFTIERMKLERFSRDLLAELYQEHKGKDFYESIVGGFAGEPMVALVLSGTENTIERVRSLMGATDPVEAAPGTIRGDFAHDMEPDNIMHASDSPKSAAREINLFFPDHLKS